MNSLSARWLGRMQFADALALQEEIVARKRYDPCSDDQLLLLRTNRCIPSDGLLIGPVCSVLHICSIPFFRSIARSGAIYHGPGQLIGYPIIDLRRCGQDLHKYLRWLERLLIELLLEYGIATNQRGSLTGVWVEDRKIASIGVEVRHWITMHGFALNMSGDLSPFDHIVPCGISNVAMTQNWKRKPQVFPLADVARGVEKLALHRMDSLRVALETQVIDA